MRGGRETQEAERWVERTRELDQDISEAWAVLRQARESAWEPGFRETWLDLVGRAGTAVSEADAQAVTRVREDLESAARAWFAADSAPRPVQGALIVNLRNILEAMDAVAEAQPVRVESRPAVALAEHRKSIA